MKLTGNQIRYLLTISDLSKKKHIVRSVDVAREMDYSRASVHKMLQSLKEMSLVEHDYYSSLKLTPSGSRMAGKYLKKYQFIKETLDTIIDFLDGYNLGICNLIELL